MHKHNQLSSTGHFHVATDGFPSHIVHSTCVPWSKCLNSFWDTSLHRDSWSIINLVLHTSRSTHLRHLSGVRPIPYWNPEELCQSGKLQVSKVLEATPYSIQTILIPRDESGQIPGSLLNGLQLEPLGTKRLVYPQTRTMLTLWCLIKNSVCRS